MAHTNPFPPMVLLPNGLLDTQARGSYAAIFERNEQQSPLLRLPGELRNRIWELLLPGGHQIYFAMRNTGGDTLN
ncbi:hypothetical protein BDV96DRAFT_643494 [Lophiotrema nucula]|uniref:Uncharacterized protein n=1 Tax=Lophiotrema nucula TaxID=690887 RepID=A0A6A5ZFI0_9PLEO|nr:hypothetical protein BDV96DRAFT_643494 [Lophiotrema nucula]